MALVEKPNDSLRIYLDPLNHLNKEIQREQFQLLTIEDTTTCTRTANVKWFAKLAVDRGYCMADTS